MKSDKETTGACFSPEALYLRGSPAERMGLDGSEWQPVEYSEVVAIVRSSDLTSLYLDINPEGEDIVQQTSHIVLSGMPSFDGPNGLISITENHLARAYRNTLANPARYLGPANREEFSRFAINMAEDKGLPMHLAMLQGYRRSVFIGISKDFFPAFRDASVAAKAEDYEAS